MITAGSGMRWTGSEAELREIEPLGRRMVTEFTDLTGLALDMTNFATFIDTGNDRAPIAQRARPSRTTDLRLVGLALVVTRDGGVPVISHAHPGDRPDVPSFPPSSTSWWPLPGPARCRVADRGL